MQVEETQSEIKANKEEDLIGTNEIPGNKNILIKIIDL